MLPIETQSGRGNAMKVDRGRRSRKKREKRTRREESYDEAERKLSALERIIKREGQRTIIRRRWQRERK